MSRPRVLQVFEPPDGGVPRHVETLVDGLMARGFRLAVAGPTHAQLRERVEREGALYVELPIVGNMVAPRQDLAAAGRLVHLARRGGFDVIHAHAQKAGLLVRAVGGCGGPPLVYSPHSYVYLHQLLRRRPGAHLRHCATLQMERLLGNVTAMTIAVSHDEREAAIRDRVVRPARIRTVPNGVRVNERVPPRAQLLEFGGGGTLFGAVTSLREQKGLPTLLDALEQIAERRGSLRFAIVGNGPLLPLVQQRLALPRLRGWVRHFPFVGCADADYRALDALVLASYWEGLSIAVLEAMGHGLPVIATAVGGTSEVVVDGETGMLVPPWDARALGKAILTLAGDRARARELGARGRERALRAFTADAMVEALAELYVELARTAHQPTSSSASW